MTTCELRGLLQPVLKQQQQQSQQQQQQQQQLYESLQHWLQMFLYQQ